MTGTEAPEPVEFDDGEFKPTPLLPDWYAAAPMQRVMLTGWRRRIALVIVISFVAINAAGLCSTYGHIVFA
jgi:hypothetical protein